MFFLFLHNVSPSQSNHSGGSDDAGLGWDQSILGWNGYRDTKKSGEMLQTTKNLVLAEHWALISSPIVWTLDPRDRRDPRPHDPKFFVTDRGQM